MLIVLLGYMGSGKSAIGKALSEHLNLPFTDLDTRIEIAEGKSIPEIFKTRGELFFRRREHELLKELLNAGEDCVLSLGGGTPAYAGNMDLIIEKTPNTFYLQHSIPSLVSRLEKERGERPIIAHLQDSDLYEFIGKHLFDRIPFYSLAAHTLPCDGKPLGTVVAEIEKKLV
jgi:shikimate kinase